MSKITPPATMPLAIRVEGARQNNLRDIDVEIPLWRVVAIVGVSGSGKSSLAIGTLYAEGMQRFMENLSTYDRNRLEQAQRPDVEVVANLPATIGLRQRPRTPGLRSTVGTMTEGTNVLRLIMSRLGTHICPNGHRVSPSLATEKEEANCPVCGILFQMPNAESFSFNSVGACPTCDGLGQQFLIDEESLIGDPSKTIRQGAVLPWNSGGKRLSMFVAEQLGVRLDVPYRNLTAAERDIVMHAPPTVRRVTLKAGTPREVTLSVRFENAVAAVSRSVHEDDGGSRRGTDRFLRARICPDCEGSRLRPEALRSTLSGRNIAEIVAMDITEAKLFMESVIAVVPPELRRVASALLGQFGDVSSALLDLGLSYLSLERAGNTLSTGERQRIELMSKVRLNTTGMLFVLDEPSVGLHPSNIAGLSRTIEALAANGNAVVLVEHDVDVISRCDWLIEMGPGAGAAGGLVISEGPPDAIRSDPASLIAPFLDGTPAIRRDRRVHASGAPSIELEVEGLWNLRAVQARFPLGALTAVAGPSGAGKTALVLDSLVPAVKDAVEGRDPPAHVKRLDPAGITQLAEIDATPIGQNARSTPATYSGAFDVIRKLFAAAPLARERGWNAGFFSFNTKAGQCSTCEGLGEVKVDVQYLPDISEPCPACNGTRYRAEILEVTVGGRSIADVLDLTVDEALIEFSSDGPISRALAPIADVGLGYVRLGDATPRLSGGESQRLRIASRLRTSQANTLYVFDEPSTGLHPLDLRVLVEVFDRLLDDGATIIVIDHDLDLLAAADHLIDMGPVGGPDGGKISAQGTPVEVAYASSSATGPYLKSRVSFPTNPS